MSTTLSIVFAVTFSLLMCMPKLSTAQSDSQPVLHASSVVYTNTELELMSTEKKETETVNAAEKNAIASFKNGAADLDTYISNHVTYPEIAQTYAYEGTTIIRFKVMPDGTLNEFMVVQSTHPICDKEVIKTLKQMPKWDAAKQNGKPVATSQQVSVDFRLQ